MAARYDENLTALLEGLITQYGKGGSYKRKTAEDIRKQAQDEYQSYYDAQRLAAQQAYERSDLSLANQLAGLQSTYDKSREASAKEYRQAYSQADRSMLGRGMGRSTYAGQTLSNIGLKAAEAQQDIWDAQAQAEGNINAQRQQQAEQLSRQLQQYDVSQATDVMNRERQLEEQDYDRGFQNEQYQNQLASQIYSMLASQQQNEQDQEWRQKQFDYQQQRDTVSDSQWTQQFEQQVKAWENSNNQWERELAEQIRQFDILHPQPGTATGGGGGYGGSGKKSGGSGTGTAKTQTPAATGYNGFMESMDTFSDEQKAAIKGSSATIANAISNAVANPQQTLNNAATTVNKLLDFLRTGNKNNQATTTTTQKKTTTVTGGLSKR